MNIIEFLEHPEICGDTFAGPSWDRWKAVLRAQYGLPMTEEQVALFQEVAGGREPPSQRVRQGNRTVARRCGKTLTLAAEVTWLATVDAAVNNVRDRLAPGERAVAALVAVDRTQATVALNYINGLFDESGILSGMVARRTSDSIELTNGCAIQVMTNDFRRVRGRSFLCFVMDECAFYQSSDDRLNTDVELLRAVTPGLANLRGQLIVASSPYSKKGVLWNLHRKYFGVDSDECLAIQGASHQFNASLPQSIVDAAYADDPESAAAEFGGQFRSDLAQFLDRELVDALVRDEPLELPYDRRHKYFGFADPAGGGRDEFTLAIGHREGQRTVIDLVRGMRGTPAEIVAEYAQLLHAYGVRYATSDRYAGSWPADEFQRHNITLKPSGRSKSEIYTDALPWMRNGLVELPPDRQALNQFVALERRTGRGSGRDTIDHPRGGNDDRANAIAGLVVTATQKQFVRDLSALGTLGIGAPLPYRSRRRTSSW